MTNNERSEVTAQEFWDAIDCTETLSHRTGLTDLEEVPKESTLKSFDVLISRARQEARREALKEMDEAHHMIFGKPYSECVELQKLRKEYSNQP